MGLLDQGMTALLTLIVDPIVSNIQAFTDLLTGFLDKASLATVDFLRTRLVAPLRHGLAFVDKTVSGFVRDAVTVPFAKLISDNLEDPLVDAASEVRACVWWAGGVLGGMGRDVLEGEGPRRGLQQSGRRLQAVAKTVGGGYCRLHIPLGPAVVVSERAAGP